MDEQGGGQAAADPAEPAGSYRWWASSLVAIIVVLLLVAGAVSASQSGVWPLAQLVAELGVALGLLAFGSLYVGILRGRTWALDATAWICVVLIVGGVLRAGLDLASGRVTIPLEPVAGALVLARRPTASLRPVLDRRGRWLAAILAVGATVSMWSSALAGMVAQGRVLGAESDSIRLTVAVDCSGLADGSSARIPVTVRWHWLATEPLPGATDGLVVRWFGYAGQPADTGLDFAMEGWQADPASGVWAGSGSPATILTNPIELEGPSMAFGIDVGGVGMRDDEVSLTLRPVPVDPPAHGSITLWAVYAHHDWWTQRSEDAGCSW